jgi:hypothetical protein
VAYLLDIRSYRGLEVGRMEEECEIQLLGDLRIWNVYNTRLYNYFKGRTDI